MDTLRTAVASPWAAGLRAALGLLLAATATGQDDLGSRILDAAGSERWSTQLRELGCERMPVGELLEALARSPKLSVFGSSRARLAQFFEPRRDECMAAWLGEPGARRARGPAFAMFTNLDWVERHVHAAAPERADIEALAVHLNPAWSRLRAALFDDWGPRRASAAVLLRIANRAAVEAAEAAAPGWLASQRQGEATVIALASNFHLLGCPDDVNPFAITSLFDGDATARARACVWLRRELQGALPPQAPHQDVGALCRILQDGTAPLPVMDLSRLPAAPRSQLVQALIAAAQRVPPDPPPAPRQRDPRLPSAGEQRAVHCFAVAAGADVDAARLVLALAINAREPHVRRRALQGLLSTPRLADGCTVAMAPLLVALFDDRDEQVAARAATLAAQLLAREQDAALLARIAAIARAAVADHVDDLEVLAKEPPAFCGTDENPYGSPNGVAATLLLADANSGDAQLLSPLIAALQRSLAACPAGQPMTQTARLHECLLVQCLAPLAAGADAAQAQVLVTTVVARMGPDTIRSAATDDGCRLRILGATFPQAPVSLFPMYAKWLGQACGRSFFQQGLQPMLRQLDEAHARFLLALEPKQQAPLSLLYLRDPQPLVDLWRQRWPLREAATSQLGGLMKEHGELVRELVIAGRLPREFVAASLPATWTLPQIAAVLPADASDARAWAAHLAAAIQAAPASTPALDREALHALAASPVPEVCIAAARRLAGGSDSDRRAAAARLADLAASPDQACTANALEVAIRFGLLLPDLDQALARLRGAPAWRHRVIADAAGLRFTGLDPRQLASEYPAQAIALAGIDVDLDLLRAALQAGNGIEANLPQLHGASATTRANGLTLAAELADWTAAIEAAVLTATTDADPLVRLAAYRALRTRDPEVWLCAWLAREAEFDPDIRVRNAK